MVSPQVLLLWARCTRYNLNRPNQWLLWYLAWNVIVPIKWTHIHNQNVYTPVKNKGTTRFLTKSGIENICFEWTLSCSVLYTSTLLNRRHIIVIPTISRLQSVKRLKSCNGRSSKSSWRPWNICIDWDMRDP